MNQDTNILREVAKLKLMCRVLFALIVCLGVLFALFLWLDLTRPKTELRAEQFILLDHLHRPVARLRSDGSGACLDLNGESKTAGAIICASDEIGSYVGLTNERGQTHAVVSAGINPWEDGGTPFPPGLRVSTANGLKVLDVSVGGESKLTLGDSLERSTFVVVTPSSGQPQIDLKYNGANIPLRPNTRGLIR